jgi:hypothetical protein
VGWGGGAVLSNKKYRIISISLNEIDVIYFK